MQLVKAGICVNVSSPVLSWNENFIMPMRKPDEFLFSPPSENSDTAVGYRGSEDGRTNEKRLAS